MIASREPSPLRVARNASTGGHNKCPCDACNHFVQFYEGDSYLVECVGSFLREGWRQDSRGLVIATSEHIEQIDQWLRNAGLPVDELAESNRYLRLDAAETLQRFCIAGEPNEALFREVVGKLVRDLTVPGQELRAFGEMVALLWRDGKRDAAIRLEEFWNGLAAEHQFNLMCAYPIRGFGSASAAHHFAEVCRTHNRVLPTEAFRSPRAGFGDEALREIALLQQRAAALELEMGDRASAEKQLRQRESELTAFVESATIGLHWVDAEGRIIWANQAELDLLGYAWDEYVGRSISNFHADSPIIDDILARLCRGEKLKDYEARLRCKDGSIKTVLIDSSVLWDNGRFVHTQCFTRDVTEQRRSDEMNRHMAAIVAGSNDAIFSKDLDGIITSWNAAAERIYGYTSQEIVGRSIKTLIPPERLSEEDMILAKLRTGEKLEGYETVRRRKDGKLIDVSLTISPVSNAKGKIIGASKISRDITEQKKNAAALERARQQLSVLNAELQQQVADLRRLHQLSSKFYAAGSVQELLEEVLSAALDVNHTNKGLLSLATPDDAGLRSATSRGFSPEFLGAIAFVPSGAGACGSSHRERRRIVIEDTLVDQAFAPYRDWSKKEGFRSVHSTPLIAHDGTLIGVLSVHYAEPRRPSEREMQLMDLYARHAADLIENARLHEQLATELERRKATAEQLKQAHDELARTNAELEQRVNERTASLTDLLSQMETFSYTVSHDLRAPLRAMAGYARILQSEYSTKLDEDGVNYVERILHASERMNRLITDVLAYTRVNRDRLDLKPLSLSESVAQVVQHSLELQPPNASVTIQPNAPAALGNEAFLTQVFSNLLGNAVKFVPPDRAPHVTVSFERVGEFVRTDIRDNGIGILPEHQEKLFGLFERLNRSYEGTGIGLAIVKRAVERMGGAVGIASDGKTGSRFWFTLRAADDANSSAPENEESRPGHE